MDSNQSYQGGNMQKLSHPPPGAGPLQGFPPQNWQPPPPPPQNVNQNNASYMNPPFSNPPFPNQPYSNSYHDPSYRPFMGQTETSGNQFPRPPQGPYAAPPGAPSPQGQAPTPYGSFNTFQGSAPGPYQPRPPQGLNQWPTGPMHHFSGPPPGTGANFTGPPPGTRTNFSGPPPSSVTNFSGPPPGPVNNFSGPLPPYGPMNNFPHLLPNSAQAVPPPNFSAHLPSAIGIKPKPPQKTKLSNSEKGKQKLEEWLQKFRKPMKTTKPEIPASNDKGPKMWEFIQQLSSLSKHLASMSSQLEEMDKIVTTADSAVWETAANQLSSMKDNVSEMAMNFDDQKVDLMEKKLLERRKKRARMKRARKERYEASVHQKENWEEKNKKIDAWQEKYTSELKEENKKKARKAAADRTLSKVNKEIHDANRLIETMTALQKLRLVRRDAAEKRGDADLGESREIFEQKISDMIRLVKGQLEFYKEEESRLKRIIKSEVEESNKKEQEILDEKNMARQMKEDAELSTMLFGPNADAKVEESNPMFPFEQYYNQAQHSLQAFLSIRHQWDAFLATENTPGASCIPSSWVIPDEPSSAAWATFLK